MEDYQNHKNPRQALHEEGKKSLKKWRNLVTLGRENEQQKLDLAVFSIFFQKRALII